MLFFLTVRSILNLENTSSNEIKFLLFSNNSGFSMPKNHYSNKIPLNITEGKKKDFFNSITKKLCNINFDSSKSIYSEIFEFFKDSLFFNKLFLHNTNTNILLSFIYNYLFIFNEQLYERNKTKYDEKIFSKKLESFDLKKFSQMTTRLQKFIEISLFESIIENENKHITFLNTLFNKNIIDYEFYSSAEKDYYVFFSEQNTYATKIEREPSNLSYRAVAKIAQQIIFKPNGSYAENMIILLALLKTLKTNNLLKTKSEDNLFVEYHTNIKTDKNSHKELCKSISHLMKFLLECENSIFKKYKKQDFEFFFKKKEYELKRDFFFEININNINYVRITLQHFTETMPNLFEIIKKNLIEFENFLRKKKKFFDRNSIKKEDFLADKNSIFLDIDFLENMIKEKIKLIIT